MCSTYQQLKRIKKNSIVLEKQENIEIQQNSSSYRQRTSSLIRERFYQQPEKQTESKDKDFCQYSDSISKILQDSTVLEKVHDTSQKLSNLEESINHEIKKLQLQQSRLLIAGKKMERKKTKKQRCPSNERATWSDHLASNSCKERKNQEPLEIAKERFSLQHQCVSTSPRYGSDRDLQPRPRMRSVSSQIEAKEKHLEQGAAGDHNSVVHIKENKHKFANIAPQNDQIVNCCYGLTCQPVQQKTGQRHNYQQIGNERTNREYNYCRDEYYYELPNCSFNTQYKTCSNNVAAAGKYRRQSTDLNTQEFYCRPRDRTSSPEPTTKIKSKNKSKACKTNESQDECNEGKKRECEERAKKHKQRRSKSINAHEQKAAKIERLCEILKKEESALKIIKYLDRYVDDCDKELSFKNLKVGSLQISDDSSAPTTVQVKSQTKLCQVTVRKKQESNKNPQPFKEGSDNVSLDTQYSLETLRMLKKMTIREYKPVKPKDKKDFDDKKLDKVTRYREYLDKYEREQQAKKPIQILKEPPELFPKHESRESIDLKRETATSSEQLREYGDYSVIDKTNRGNFPTDSSKLVPESSSYEELRYEYGAARRSMEGWDDYRKYSEPEKSRYSKEEDARRSRERERQAEDQRSEDTEIYRKSRDRKPKVEDQRSRTAAKQDHSEIYKKSRDRERKSDDQTSRYYGDNKRRYSQETKQHKIEHLSEDDFKGVKQEPEYTEKSLKSERKSRDRKGYRYNEEKRRDSKETKQHPTENLRRAVAKAEYQDENFKESRGNERNSKEPGSRYYKEKRRDSLERRQYPRELPNQRGDQPNYHKENFRQSKENKKEHPKPRDKYYEGKRRDSEEYRPQLKEQFHRNEDFETESYEPFEERKQQIVGNYEEELDEQPKNLEEIKRKPGYYQESYKRQKRSLEPPFKYENQERESAAMSSLLKEPQNYHTKQEPPLKHYPPKQEETRSTQYESLYKDEPANMNFNDIEKKSNSPSYNEFKQVMDYSLGFHTSRASQTDYQFKPEVNEQQSTLTYTRANETLDNNKDQVILSSKNQQELLQKGQEIPNDPSSLSPTTTEDALSYLKNFLKTCQRSGLEGECLDAVTSAAHDLITKLSSCKSFVQTESLSKLNLESIDTLEKKLTQDTQYKDPESTTDSSENRLNQKMKAQENYLETLQELEANEEPTNICQQQESYHYQSSRPIDQQYIETLEIYKNYVECEESMPSLEPPIEFTNKQESLQADNSQYMEMDCEQKLYESPADGECKYRPLPNPSRQLAFDPELIPLKGILKPCRVMESPQMALYDLETYRTTSVVNFRQKDHINMESASSMTYKQGQEEMAQQCNETQQTIISKDEFLQPIAKQSKYLLCSSTSTKQPMYQDCLQESDLATETYSSNNSPHLYTVETPTFKQCPCMLDMYKKMMENYYKGKGINNLLGKFI